MRVLVAATCIAVLAVIGYFFWGEWSETRRLAAEQQAVQAAAAQLAKDRAPCIPLVQTALTNSSEALNIGDDLKKCRDRGLLTNDEIRRLTSDPFGPEYQW